VESLRFIMEHFLMRLFSQIVTSPR
jgi:hypothetical protein